MAEITRKGGLFSTVVAGTDRVGGLECAVSGSRKVFRGCRYEVLLDTPGKSDEPRIIASGTFVEAFKALQKDSSTKPCTALLKAVSRSLGDPESDITRRFSEAELSVMALLIGDEMTAGMMGSMLRMPEGTLAIAIAQLHSDGFIWRRLAAGEAERPYTLSEIGKRMCELMKEEERFIEAARRILGSGG